MSTYDRVDSDSQNTSGNKRPDEKVQSLVRELVKSGLTDQEAYRRIRKQITDDKVREIAHAAYLERKKIIAKYASKFARKMQTNSEYHTFTAEERMKRARQYAKANGIDSEEVDLFLKSLLGLKTYENIYNVPVTPISKLFGLRAIKETSDPLDVPASELSEVNDIISMRASSAVLHSNVTLQSFSYQDCDRSALHGGGSTALYRQNIYTHINPVLFALFVPKVKVLDECILLSNFGTIIEAKHRRAPFRTQADYALYNNLVNDPTGFLCDEKSPIRDIKHRFTIQNLIWENILSLRQGLYYTPAAQNLNSAINSCRNNVFEAPDMTYISDEGTYLRRLLGAFSLRPTFVSTVSAFNQYPNLVDPYGLQTHSYSGSYHGQNLEKITSISMITVRLPLVHNAEGSQVTRLEDSLRQQQQWYKEGSAIVPKFQTIVNSNGVVFFHVNRRYNTIKLQPQNACHFDRLPSQINGWEALNMSPVEFSCEINITGEVYDLRSVIMTEVNPLHKNMIIGTTAAIIIPDYPGNPWGNTMGKSVVVYDPVGAKFFDMTSDNKEKYNSALSYINYDYVVEKDTPEPLTCIAATRGSIFMYVRRPNRAPCPESNNFY